MSQSLEIPVPTQPIAVFSRCGSLEVPEYQAILKTPQVAIPRLLVRSFFMIGGEITFEPLVLKGFASHLAKQAQKRHPVVGYAATFVFKPQELREGGVLADLQVGKPSPNIGTPMSFDDGKPILQIGTERLASFVAPLFNLNGLLVKNKSSSGIETTNLDNEIGVFLASRAIFAIADMDQIRSLGVRNTQPEVIYKGPEVDYILTGAE